MKSLQQLPLRKLRSKSVVSPLPVSLTPEERQQSRICPMLQYTVTMFSCLQCDRFEVYKRRVRELTKVTGKCMHPRKASLESRRITRWDPFGVKRKKKKKGGMTDKVDYAIDLIKANKHTRKQIIGLLVSKFNIGEAYAASVQYQAKKKVENEVWE